MKFCAPPWPRTHEVFFRLGGAMNREPCQPIWDDNRLASVHAQADKAVRVRRMFDAIAPTYELVNSLFSAGRDRAWRKKAVRLARVREGDAVLDIACGTGDFLRAFGRWAAGATRLVGTDFSHRMLKQAVEESAASMRWCEADGLSLPFADGSFDVTSCAFGVRNFQDLQRGLNEMHRVLRPAGRCVILEFSRPRNRAIRAIHEFYCGKIMPVGAALVSGDRTGAYRYLPQSVVSFPAPEEMTDRLREAGFSDVRAVPLTFGAVTVYVATKVPG
jgi:demethylmenaquinone methyltransferase/2-methoxy-6-polyprenyl-1,4-benzoquinol methylase